MHKSILLITILVCSVFAMGQLNKTQKTSSKPTQKTSNSIPTMADLPFMPGIKGWKVFCQVTVKGKLEQKDENGGYHKEFIDRTYKLEAVLEVVAPIAAEQAKTTSKNQYAIPKFSGYTWSVNTVKKDVPFRQIGFSPITVVIKDSFAYLIKEKLDGESFENTEQFGTVREFENELTTPPSIKISVKEDGTISNYNIRAVMVPTAEDQNLVTKTRRKIYRSKAGHGDDPTTEDTTFITKSSVHFLDDFPQVVKLLESGILSVTGSFNGKTKDGYLHDTFDTGEISCSENAAASKAAAYHGYLFPLLPCGPQKDIKIRLYYEITNKID